MKNFTNTIDPSYVQTIPSYTSRTADKGIKTQRGLCTNLPYNAHVLNNMVLLSDEAIEKGTTWPAEQYAPITNVEDLKKALSNVLIRFDNSPSYYTKNDYRALMGTLVRSLVFLYQFGENMTSDNDFILQIIHNADGTITLSPQVGQMDPEADVLDPDNPEKLAKIGDIRDYVAKQLTWEVL